MGPVPVFWCETGQIWPPFFSLHVCYCANLAPEVLFHRVSFSPLITPYEYVDVSGAKTVLASLKDPSFTRSDANASELWAEKADENACSPEAAAVLSDICV